MRSLTGRQVLLLAAAVFLVATIAVGVYGLVRAQVARPRRRPRARRTTPRWSRIRMRR